MLYFVIKLNSTQELSWVELSWKDDRLRIEAAHLELFDPFERVLRWTSAEHVQAFRGAHLEATLGFRFAQTRSAHRSARHHVYRVQGFFGGRLCRRLYEIVGTVRAPVHARRQTLVDRLDVAQVDDSFDHRVLCRIVVSQLKNSNETHLKIGFLRIIMNLFNYLMLDRVENKIAFFPLFKEGALFFQIASIGLMLIGAHHTSRPVDETTIVSVLTVMVGVWRGWRGARIVGMERSLIFMKDLMMMMMVVAILMRMMVQVQVFSVVAILVGVRFGIILLMTVLAISTVCWCLIEPDRFI